MFLSGKIERDGLMNDLRQPVFCRMGGEAPLAALRESLTYADAPRGVTVDLALGFAHDAGTSFANPPSFFDQVSGVVDVQGSAFRDNLYGDAQGNRLSGGAGNDWLDGGAGGYDTLDGGAGADAFQLNLDAAFTLVLGGEGNDMLFADDRGADMVFDLATGLVTADGALKAVMSSVEIVHGAGGDDVFLAAEGRSIFYGGEGSDLFVFAPGTAAASAEAGEIDAIFRFGGFDGVDGDRISLGVTGGYAELNAATYGDAYAAAQGLVTSGARDIVAVQVEGDVYVFADSLGTNSLSTAIKLDVADLARIGEGDFI